MRTSSEGHMQLEVPESNASRWRYYLAYGLVIKSQIHFPELSEVSAENPEISQSHVISIVTGKVPKNLENCSHQGAYFQVSGDSALIVINSVVRMLVKDAEKVVVESLNGTQTQDLRVFILGSALGLVLHQLKLLPMHVAALETPFGAVAITGVSGAGKSTAAVNLNLLTSWKIICDDVAVASISDDQVSLVSGINRVKLWEDAAADLQIDTEHLPRDMLRYNKFHLSKDQLFAKGSSKLQLLVVFRLGGFEIRRLSGMEKFAAILNSVYRPEIANIFWEHSELAAKCAQISNCVDVVELTRNKDSLPADETAQILRDLFVSESDRRTAK